MPLRAPLPFLFLAVLLPAADPGDPPSPWDQATLGLIREAYRNFARQAGPNREARFGEAVTLLNLQPKTGANLDRAASLFTDIIATEPADGLGVSARYYVARIAHVHRTSPDDATALRIYRELADLSSPHPLAQRALVQLALMEIFEPRLDPAEVRVRFERLTARGAALTESSAVRDFHLVMGDAALRFNLGEAIALDHLLAADRVGLARAATQRDTWVRIAELGRRTGRNDIAVTYYQRFLENFPRDSRRRMIIERLAALLPTSESSREHPQVEVTR